MKTQKSKGMKNIRILIKPVLFVIIFYLQDLIFLTSKEKYNADRLKHHLVADWQTTQSTDRRRSRGLARQYKARAGKYLT